MTSGSDKPDPASRKPPEPKPSPGPDPVPPEAAGLTEDEIRSFADQLESWGQDLPAKQRMLLNVLLLSAGNPAPKESDFRQTVMPSVQDLVSRVLLNELSRKEWVYGTDGGVWVKILNPTWTKPK